MIKAILFFILSSTLLFAGNDKGNGGDAIVCRAPIYEYVQTAELLDYYEGRELRSFNMLVNTSMTIREKVLSYVEKLAYHSLINHDKFFYDVKDEALLLIEAAEAFEQGKMNTAEVKFVKSILVDIPDSDSLSIPRWCEIEQLAIRLNKRFEDDPRYLIQADIYKVLDTDQRAGLILHELIYKAFVVHQNHTDSRAARYFHQLMLQNNAEDFTLEKYKLYLQKAKIRKLM